MRQVDGLHDNLLQELQRTLESDKRALEHIRINEKELARNEKRRQEINTELAAVETVKRLAKELGYNG